MPALTASDIKMSVPARSIAPFKLLIPALAKSWPLTAAFPAASETPSGPLTPVVALAMELICATRLMSPGAFSRKVLIPPLASSPTNPTVSITLIANGPPS